MPTYATASDLTAWTGTAAPDDADRKLKRASEIIDAALLTAYYATDNTGAATDTVIVAALRDATCAQVEFWLAGDEEDDVLGPLQSIQLGSMGQTFGAGQNRVTPTDVAPRAIRVLSNAGLLSATVWTL